MVPRLFSKNCFVRIWTTIIEYIRTEREEANGIYISKMPKNIIITYKVAIVFRKLLY